MGLRVRDHRLSDVAGSGAAVSSRQKSLPAAFRRVAATVRASLRFLIVLATLGEIGIRYGLLRLRRGSSLSLEERARWLHDSCAVILRRMGIRMACRGWRPSRGLLCSNHLGYLDILAFAAATPCIFISRSDVREWPIFGRFARGSGTIFVDRQSRAGTEDVARQMAEALEAGVPILLFPEGTSTDGSRVLRFHPSLLEPAVERSEEVTAAAIGYRVRQGAERDLCWHGDASFVPHLLRTLGRTGMEAEIEFHPDRNVYSDRKAAALDLHEKVEAMRRRIIRGQL